MQYAGCVAPSQVHVLVRLKIDATITAVKLSF